MKITCAEKYSARYYCLNISTFPHHHKIFRTKVTIINVKKEAETLIFKNVSLKLIPQPKSHLRNLYAYVCGWKFLTLRTACIQNCFKSETGAKIFYVSIELGHPKNNYNTIIKILNKTYIIQSIIGQTDKHRVHPVQSSFTCGICVCPSNSIAWYPESLQAI